MIRLGKRIGYNMITIRGFISVINIRSFLSCDVRCAFMPLTSSNCTDESVQNTLENILFTATEHP